jgi:hypothetical protein
MTYTISPTFMIEKDNFDAIFKKEKNSLVEERLLWRKQFELGNHYTSSILEDYKRNRLSNSWRMSGYIEQMCEYILYLEENQREQKDSR